MPRMLDIPTPTAHGGPWCPSVQPSPRERELEAKLDWKRLQIQLMLDLQPKPKTYLTAKEASARYFGGKVAPRTWYRGAESGLVPCVHFGGKVLFRADDLDKLESTGTFPTESPARPVTPRPVVIPRPSPSNPSQTVFRFFPKRT